MQKCNELFMSGVEKKLHVLKNNNNKKVVDKKRKRVRGKKECIQERSFCVRTH